MATIEKLQPATKADTLMYQPYYPKEQHEILPYALALYQQGYLEGERIIDGGNSIPFVATWYVSRLPSELTRCRLQFDGSADLSYEINLPNSGFVQYLITLIKDFNSSHKTDFSQQFYRKLLRLDE
ncbi:MAG: type IV pilus biogenesis protein EbsA [Cyanobacterium sp.]